MPGRRFVEGIQPQIQSRMETEVVTEANNTWVLLEEAISYGQYAGPKITAKPQR